MLAGSTEEERERRRVNLLIMGKMTDDMRFFEKLSSDLRVQQWSYKEVREEDKCSSDTDTFHTIQGMSLIINYQIIKHF